MQPRRSRDTAEMQPRCSRDTAETQPRHSRHIRRRRARRGRRKRGEVRATVREGGAASHVELPNGQAMLAREFGAAFKKLTELGCEGVLQPEVAAGGLAAAR